jgi:hypothetical protein
MIKIQDVIVPTKGTAKYFNVIALNFPMNPSSVTFYWQIFSEVSEPADQSDEQPTLNPGVSLMDGNLTMDQTTYNSWNNDDTYVIDWALAQLGFTKI